MTELRSTPNFFDFRTHRDPTAASWLPGVSFPTPWGSGASGARWLQLISGRLANMHAVVEIAVIELASVVEIVVIEPAIGTAADAGAVCSIAASAMALADSCRLRFESAAADAADG